MPVFLQLKHLSSMITVLTELYNRLIVKVNETLRLAQGNDISEFKTFIEQEVTDEVTIIPLKESAIYQKS